jgi:hypothetical protein
MPSAATTEGGRAMNAAPDVCCLPAPTPPAGPGGIPTPYPNMAMLTGAKKTTTKVLVRNKKALVEGSRIDSSRGDEAGCSPNPTPARKGMAVAKNMAKVTFEKHSGKVKFQGKGVIFHGVPTKHNAGNTMGTFASASQSQVEVGT